MEEISDVMKQETKKDSRADEQASDTAAAIEDQGKKDDEKISLNKSRSTRHSKSKSPKSVDISKMEKKANEGTPLKNKSDSYSDDDEEDIEDDDLKYHPNDSHNVILDVIDDCGNTDCKKKEPDDVTVEPNANDEMETKPQESVEEKASISQDSNSVTEENENDQRKSTNSESLNDDEPTKSTVVRKEEDHSTEIIAKAEPSVPEDLVNGKPREPLSDNDTKVKNGEEEKCADDNNVPKSEKLDCKESEEPLRVPEDKDKTKIDEISNSVETSEVNSEGTVGKDSSLGKVQTEDTASDNETPTLAILDVRTVCDDETLSENEDKSEPKVTVEDKKGPVSKVESTKVKKEKAKDAAKDSTKPRVNEKTVTKTEKDVETESSLEVLTTKIEEGDEEITVKKEKEPKTKETGLTDAVSSKKLQGKACLVCDKVKLCKFQVLMLGITKYLCDDACFKVFRNKTHKPFKSSGSSTSSEPINENRPITRSITNPKDVCNVCHKDIKNGMGLLPGIGENKPLCSEECMKTYQAEQGLKRACAQCGKHIQSRTKCLTWEAMEFCNELCLGNYQIYLGSHCAFCNKAVPQTYIGKYCVRFGLDIKQFCSNGCLEDFKSGLKVCSYCQKDISAGPEGFLAPVGDKGQFKEFCTHACLEKFELMGNASSQPSFKKCSMCKKLSSVNVEVTFEGKEHKLCSESCVAAFRYANKINTSICDTCHKFFDLDISKQLTIQFEGSSKRFCAKACMNVFVLYHRKVVPCSWCRVKKYNFDMIERVDSNNHVQLFCSLNCLSLFRVSLNATSSRRVQCDYCRQVKPAQFHLTMSDASIRNFCTLNCAMHFQGQFSTVAPVITTTTATTTTSDTPVTTSTTGSSKAATIIAAGTPIISSVVSLAPSSSQQTTLATSTHTPKAVFVMAGAGATTATSTSISKPIVVKHSITTQTQGVAISHQVVVRPPVAKSVKNKAVICRPMVQTKGVSCKPHPCHKHVQTDEVKQNPIFIPVPVPVYIPVPMRMYTTPVPVPLPFPIPIPVPIFIPTTKNSAHGIFKQIKEIQQKIPDNPFEADLILMAEMVAEESKDKKGKLKAIKQSEPSNLEESEGESFGPESTQTESCQTTNAFGDEVLQMALRMAENVDLEAALSTTSNALSHNPAPEENGGDECLSGRQLRSVNKNKRPNSRGRGGRGRKRIKTEEPSENATPASPVLPSSLSSAYGLHTVVTPQIESNCVLKYSYGVNAWKHWVLQKNNQLEKATGSHRKLKLFKTDLLQLTAEELCYSLCLFVKEVRKPNSEEYAPDSIYYLCLGIQQYLFENGRIDNIFSDAYYEKFTISLNDVLQRYEINLTHDGLFLSRIEEEILWESKQLGAHSPHVLLNTLMYFNTKYFLLKTVEDHLQLSFSHILKQWKKTPGGGKASGGGGTGNRNVLLRYYPPSQTKETNRRKKESVPAFEQVENVENPLRCPVKLYEFYLSKCSPESIKSRNDVFYLYPERSCVPDSPVWYSTMPLGKESIAKMLQRIRMVREVGESIMAAS